MPTYKEQFDKLTSAYINNEIRPYDSCACFVGNLLNNTEDWSYYRTMTVEGAGRIIDKSQLQLILEKEVDGFYTPNEIVKLEKVFLRSIFEKSQGEIMTEAAINEDALFIAFEKTLDLLKQIHESKGEIIDDVPAFTKRELINA